MNTQLKYLVGLTIALSSPIALAEGAGISAEVKPLPLIVNALPGSSAFAAEGEVAVGSNLGLFVGVSHLALGVSNKMIDEQREEKGTDEVLVKDFATDALTLGTRYYTNPTGSSWYGSLDAGFGKAKSTWLYEDVKVTDSGNYYLGGVQAGYRWQWDGGFLIRLGGGVNYSSTVDADRKVSGGEDDGSRRKAEDEIDDKQKKNYAAVTPTLDFGLGWRF